MVDEQIDRMTTGEVRRRAERAGVNDVEQMNKQQMAEALGYGHGGHDPSAPGQGGGKGDTPAPKGADPSEYKDFPGNQT